MKNITLTKYALLSTYVGALALTCLMGACQKAAEEVIPAARIATPRQNDAAVAASILDANSSSGSAYPTIDNSAYAHENPDCQHGAFGPHVTQAGDNQLGRNVFVFHSHINSDNDRCINLDRVRMEVKGNDANTMHSHEETAYYRWKFKLDANFAGSSSFTHIFQIKATAEDADMPIITITPRASVLEVIHNAGASGSSLGVVKSVSLAPFKGTWVEAYVKYYNSSSGSFEITLKRVSDGATLLSYTKTGGIDMWRGGSGQLNRGKWGIYRLKGGSGLRDEQVRFANICVSETSSSACPSFK